MTRILVIEPHQMLRYAFTVALCLEHQVEIVDRIPEQGALKETALVIIDVAALRGRNALAVPDLSAVRSWKVPTIWIDGDAGAQAPAREKLLRLTWPLEKDALRKAVEQCLAKVDVLSRTDPKATSQAESPAAAKGQPAEARSSQSNTNAANQFIELVDVVE